MKVSDLARRAGIAASAVRFYEAEGILPGPPRSENRYRRYTEADLCRLRMVVALRKLGLGLQDSGRLATQCCGGECDETAVELAGLIEERRTSFGGIRPQSQGDGRTPDNQ